MAKRYSDEQINAKLQEADALQAEGASRTEIAATLGISRSTLKRWRRKYGGNPVDEIPDAATEKTASGEANQVTLKDLGAEDLLDVVRAKAIQDAKDELVRWTRHRFWLVFIVVQAVVVLIGAFGAAGVLRLFVDAELKHVREQSTQAEVTARVADQKLTAYDQSLLQMSERISTGTRQVEGELTTLQRDAEVQKGQVEALLLDATKLGVDANKELTRAIELSTQADSLVTTAQTTIESATSTAMAEIASLHSEVNDLRGLLQLLGIQIAQTDRLRAILASPNRDEATMNGRVKVAVAARPRGILTVAHMRRAQELLAQYGFSESPGGVRMVITNTDTGMELVYDHLVQEGGRGDSLERIEALLDAGRPRVIVLFGEDLSQTSADSIAAVVQASLASDPEIDESRFKFVTRRSSELDFEPHEAWVILP